MINVFENFRDIKFKNLCGVSNNYLLDQDRVNPTANSNLALQWANINRDRVMVKRLLEDKKQIKINKFEK